MNMNAVDYIYNMHPEPYPGYRFNVYIQAVTMSFSKISHLEDSIDTEPLVEGGLNHHVHSLLKPVSRERQVVFERGMAFRGAATALLTDRFHVGQRLNTDIVVAINDRGGQLRNLLLLHGAVVREWNCSDLDAMSSAILLERFVLAYETLESFPTAAGVLGELGVPGLVSIPNSRESGAAQGTESGSQRESQESETPPEAETGDSAAPQDDDAKERAEKIDEIKRKRALAAG